MRALAGALDLNFTYHFARDPYHNDDDRQMLEDVANLVLWERHQVEYEEPRVQGRYTRWFSFKWSVPLFCRVEYPVMLALGLKTLYKDQMPVYVLMIYRELIYGFYQIPTLARFVLTLTCTPPTKRPTAQDPTFLPSIHLSLRWQRSFGPVKRREAPFCSVER